MMMDELIRGTSREARMSYVGVIDAKLPSMFDVPISAYPRWGERLFESLRITGPVSYRGGVYDAVADCIHVSLASTRVARDAAAVPVPMEEVIRAIDAKYSDPVPAE